jgi:hypothetical protein
MFGFTQEKQTTELSPHNGSLCDNVSKGSE